MPGSPGLLRNRKPGHSLPFALHADEEIVHADMAAALQTTWLFACSVADIPRPGYGVTMQVGNGPVGALHDRDGEVAAVHNTRRHRGSMICEKEQGRVYRPVCPGNGPMNWMAPWSTPAKYRSTSINPCIPLRRCMSR